MPLPQEAAEVLAPFARNFKAAPSLDDDERFDAFIVHCYEHDIPATVRDVREFLLKSAIGQRTDAKQIINMYVARYELGRALLALYYRQRAAG
jgi:hypothetical protein